MPEYSVVPSAFVARGQAYLYQGTVFMHPLDVAVMTPWHVLWEAFEARLRLRVADANAKLEQLERSL